MKLKQLLEQLNQLAKERPEALEMEVYCEDDNTTLEFPVKSVDIFWNYHGNDMINDFEAVRLKFAH